MRFGWSLVSGLVRSVVVVVPLVLGEDVSSVRLVEDQDVIAHFTAEGSDDPFAVRVHPWRLGCAGQDVHVLGLEDGVEGGRVLRIAVSEQKPEGIQTFTDIGSEVASLLCRPVLGRAGGDARHV